MKKIKMMMEQLFKNKTNNTVIQLFRYTFVGGLSFIFDFGSLYILTEYFNIYYLVSAAIAFMLGLTINYLLSISWVFEKRSIESKHVEFFIFAIIGIVGLALNELFIWFFTEIVGAYYLYSKLMSTGLVYLWNFFVRKYTLFR
jgi:putative flippase GtrA